jgi:hypothetical protein
MYPPSISTPNASSLPSQSGNTGKASATGRNSQNQEIKEKTAKEKSKFKEAKSAALARKQNNEAQPKTKAERKIAKGKKQLHKTRSKFDKEVSKREAQYQKKMEKMNEKAAKAAKDKMSEETYEIFQSKLYEAKHTFGVIASNEAKHVAKSLGKKENLGGGKIRSEQSIKKESTGLYKVFKDQLKSVPKSVWKRLSPETQRTINQKLETENKRLHDVANLSRNNKESGLARLRELLKTDKTDSKTKT